MLAFLFFINSTTIFTASILLQLLNFLIFNSDHNLQFLNLRFRRLQLRPKLVPFLHKMLNLLPKPQQLIPLIISFLVMLTIFVD